MARPKKKGLKYFTNDVDFYQDIKIRKLIHHKGIQAVSVYHIILCQIYSQGYYLQWDEDSPFILSEVSGLQEVKAQEYVEECVAVGLFDKTLFETEKVLTSHAIQERYFEIISAAKRKIEEPLPYLIVKVAGKFLYKSKDAENSSDTQVKSEQKIVNSEETGINSEETRNNSEFSTQRKEKESKDNNSLRSSLSLPPSTTTPPAHARKSFGDEKGDCDHDDPMTANEGVGILKTDKDWLLQVQRKFALDKSIILGWLDSFCNDCNCRGKQQHENLADVKQHFIDWMSKQLNSKNNKKTCKEKVIKITPEKIWLRCQAELSQSVSDEITKQTIESLIFENYDAKSSILLLDIPNRKCSEYIEENCITTLTKVLQKHFGKNIKLNYRLPESP